MRMRRLSRVVPALLTRISTGPKASPTPVKERLDVLRGRHVPFEESRTGRRSLAPAPRPLRRRRRSSGRRSRPSRPPWRAGRRRASYAAPAAGHERYPSLHILALHPVGEREHELGLAGALAVHRRATLAAADPALETRDLDLHRQHVPGYDLPPEPDAVDAGEERELVRVISRAPSPLRHRPAPAPRR